MKRILLMAGASVLALGTAASAATLSLGGPNLTAGNIPGVDVNQQAFTPENDVLEDLLGITELGGFFGSTVSVDEDTTIRVDFFGFEATLENTFSMGGNSVGTTGNPPFEVIAADLGSPLDSFSVAATAGELEFSFTSGATVVENGMNPADQAGVMNFFASFGPGNEDATEGEVLWLFLDDAGQVGDNHDDLVVRISVAAIPLPAAGFLLLGALGGLGVAARRKKA